MDQWLSILEVRLDELGVDDVTVGAFIGAYNDADRSERARFKSMGDRALLRYVRNLPSARRVVDELDRAELDAQASEVIERPIREVLDWVGQDVVRAGTALSLENSTPNPRKGLVGVLVAMLGLDD